MMMESPFKLTIEQGKDYIKYIKSQTCLICGDENVDADHLKTIGMGGDRKKPHWQDFTCIPLCRKHHIERHTDNAKMQDKYRITFWRESHRLLMEWLS